ncbi:MAG: hypothetical protein ABF311_06790 [Polaribacter sp.]
MEENPVDHTIENRFELLKELLLTEDRKKFELFSARYLEKKQFKNVIRPVLDEQVNDLKENFSHHFGEEVTSAIKVQIRESQDEVVEALYPIMGKLVKKFIVSEITKLSDNINNTIQEKFSISYILGKLFKGKKTQVKEILQETFEPLIEEVFVIQKDSGLLRGSYSRGSIADKDMISGMLTAIKAFAEDAFSKEGQDLEDIKFETFQLSMFNYNTIYIAIAISGVVHAKFKDNVFENVNVLADKILRDRSFLNNQTKLNLLIENTLIIK